MATHLDGQSRRALYMLKRQYGGEIDIYKLGSSSTDVKTGRKVIATTAYHVRRAIVLPARQTRSTLTGARRRGNPARLLDVNMRQFIVDRRDAPSLPLLTSDDWIVFRGRKYQVAEVQSFEFDSGWVINAKELVGETPQQDVFVTGDNRLDMQAEGTGE